MYYKIENKECEVYKKLHEMRTKEKNFEKENEVALKEKIGLEWDVFLGYHGQQNWNRTTHYDGFKFTEPDKVDPKIWVKHKKHEGIFVPNRRTKIGREMADFLNNGLSRNRFDAPFTMLGIVHKSRFQFPYIEIVNNVIVMYFGEDYEIDSDDIIEITKKEFDKICQSA